jgi:UV DNA damage endonuclease
MFDDSVKRVGFACKYMHDNPTTSKKEIKELEQPFNGRSTTVAWLDRQTREVAEERLWDLMVYNIRSYHNMIKYVGGLDNELRMVRLGSDILPVYTHPTWSYFWQRSDCKRYCERELAKVGDIARDNDVRLSMHPGQFTVLASDRESVVERSIEEFEYHADIIRYMGYGKNWQDFKCNVHISGRQGPAGIKSILPRLSREARNCITIENDENKWGIEASLELEKEIALVIDIHHHWVNSGEYIEVNDDRIKRIIDSWRGVRPALHFSVSRENVLGVHNERVKPDFPTLLSEGHKKAKLRAHSDTYHIPAVNEWAWTFHNDFDIMCESKHKNLASIQFYNEMTGYNHKLGL